MKSHSNWRDRVETPWGASPKPNLNAENTDESLRNEREKVDQALAEKLTALQETADTVITVARARADEVLAKEREKVDQKIADAAPGLRAVLDIERERVREDRAVRKERATADRALDDERAEQVALLSTERKETDSDCSANGRLPMKRWPRGTSSWRWSVMTCAIG
jgi:cell division septum initiation protein DivIVA